MTKKTTTRTPSPIDDGFQLNVLSPKQHRCADDNENQRPPLMEQWTEPRQVSEVRREQQTAHHDEDDAADSGSKKHAFTSARGSRP